ncbi:hypothetical protein OBK30_13755, partial [Empedobacter falsenii]
QLKDNLRSEIYALFLRFLLTFRTLMINEIKSSPNFMNDSIYSRTNIIYPDRHKGKKTVWNYEDKHSYNRQYFQPKRRKLYQLSLVLNFFKIYVLRFVNKERLEHS